MWTTEAAEVNGCKLKQTRGVLADLGSAACLQHPVMNPFLWACFILIIVLNESWGPPALSSLTADSNVYFCGQREMRGKHGVICLTVVSSKWLFQILINKQPNLSSASCPVHSKPHIHYDTTYCSYWPPPIQNTYLAACYHACRWFSNRSFWELLWNVCVRFGLCEVLFICYLSWHLDSSG